MHKLMYGLTKI